MFSFTACADDLDLGLLYPLSAYLAVYLAAEPYLRNKLSAERVDNRKADAVQTSGDLIAAAAEFAAGMEHGKRNLERGFARLRVDVNGDTASVIYNGNGVIVMDGHIDMRAIACHRFVDSIIHYFVNEVMQAPLIGRADVHARTAAYCLKPFQNLYL